MLAKRNVGRILPLTTPGLCATLEIMNRNPHLNELGEFLKARRAELSPAEVGLPRRASGGVCAVCAARKWPYSPRSAPSTTRGSSRAVSRRRLPS